MKKAILFVGVIVGLAIVSFMLPLPSKTKAKINPEVSESFRRIAEKHSIEQRGRDFLKKGNYDLALNEYQKALDPNLRDHDWQKDSASYPIHFILKLQGRCEEALAMLADHLKRNPEKYEFDRLELLALMKYQESNDPDIIRKFIADYRQAESRHFPPNAGSLSDAVKVLRLYDLIGDYDAGTAFIDELLEFFEKKDIKMYGEYRFGKVDQALLNTRKAFELDKEQGTRGRVLKAILQADGLPAF
jgi:tetratricopeptide (TPR) repeat protein